MFKVLCTEHRKCDVSSNHARPASGEKKRGFNVVEVWECDIKRELEQNEEMRRYFDNYDLTDPLEPHDAFFGGRTDAAKIVPRMCRR